MSARPELRSALLGAIACLSAMLAATQIALLPTPIGAGLISLVAVGGALQAQAAVRWRRLSQIDDATGLFNRRHLFGRLAAELARARRTGVPLAFAVVEIDNMREINNRHGHLSGDAALYAVAQTLRSGVRQGDTVGRWGGDEFGLILPGASAEEALLVAERVRRMVAQQQIEVGGARVPLTISGGVALSTSYEPAIRDLIERADKAMYRAKQVKNRIAPVLE